MFFTHLVRYSHSDKLINDFILGPGEIWQQIVKVGLSLYAIHICRLPDRTINVNSFYDFKNSPHTY